MRTPLILLAHRRAKAGWQFTHGIIFVALVIGLTNLLPLQKWPWSMLVPVLFYWFAVAAIPPLRSSFEPYRWGHCNRTAVAAAIVLAAGASVLLIVFHTFKKPDVGYLRSALPAALLNHVLMGGLVFSVANALLEEIIFRGILFDSMKAVGGVGVALLLTSALFGYLHMHGYPPGILGAAMAGVFGLCQGGLRVLTGGIGLAILVHIVADATKYILLIQSRTS